MFIPEFKGTQLSHRLLTNVSVSHAFVCRCSLRLGDWYTNMYIRSSSEASAVNKTPGSNRPESILLKKFSVTGEAQQNVSMHVH